MIRRLLVANRGEIARRIFASCRAAGIETVAVYSDADASAPHVREADAAVRLPGESAAQTYLRGDLLIDAARRAGADAVHPGYGFLAENAAFAEAVIDAGLVWVGPPPKAIAAMGSKLDAKQLLAEAGVPVLASWTDPAQVTSYPVLVKASAGGGGRGMRVVRDAAELAEALASAGREAQAAFGDPTVFCEQFVEGGRHIEVQIFADAHGTVVALGERECSIQRRHQKIVEESPSPGVDDELRERICAAAVAAGSAVGYVGAGTVEFLLGPDGQFAFLEMNTRLQVEHAVTECVLGLDLVRLQLLVAEGAALPFTSPPTPRGHALEVRLYAEDPGYAWRPSTGTLHRFGIDATAAPFAPPAPSPPDGGAVGSGVRVDAGVEDGSVVTVHYDPMLAKVISWAPTRAEAVRLLAATLARARLHGVVTNRDLLVRVLRSDDFLDGRIDTAFLERHPEVFVPLVSSVDGLRLACLAAALAGSAGRRTRAPGPAIPSGWRNVFSTPQRVTFETPSGPLDLQYRFGRDGGLAAWSAQAPGADGADDDQPEVVLLALAPDRVVLDAAGLRHTFDVHQVGDVSYVDSALGAVTLPELPRLPLPAVERPEGSLLALMPGAVSRVAVAEGQRVDAGELLLTLEAMKLEHPVHAPAAGVVIAINVSAGMQVEAGAVLVVVGPGPAEPAQPEPADLT